jgi:pectate lyase
VRKLTLGVLTVVLAVVAFYPAPNSATSPTPTTIAPPGTGTSAPLVSETTGAEPSSIPPTTERVPGDVDGLLAGRLGFGGKVTGGAGGTVCVVSSLADSGAGSLRACAESAGPSWIRFGVSGEIRLGSEIEVASNKTIDGRDAKITVRGKLEMSGVNNVVIHNIRVTGSPEDAVQIKGGSSNIWLDHLDLSNSGDGLIDITQGSTNVTVSWTRFTNHDKVMLLGIDGDDARPPNVTIHHCFFDGTGQRHPRLRFGKVHMFNNYLRNWYHYGVASSDGGQTLSEANIYQAGSDPRAVLTHMADDANEGMVRSVGDLALNGAIITQRTPESVFTPPYGYQLQPATTTLADTIAANAGAG